MSTPKMLIPLSKIKATVLYLCENTDPRYLGKVKLMKLFYYLDFSHVKKYAVPITFDRYVHLEHGPIPSVIKNMVDDAIDVENSVLADTIHIEHVERIDMMRIVPVRVLTTKEKKLFSPSELETLEMVCRRFKSKNTAFIENESHSEAPWSLTEELEEIPYTLASYDKDCAVTKEDIQLGIQIAEA